MESTAPAAVRQAVLPFPVAARSLAAAFLRVSDPRRVASVAYPLAAVLSRAVAAILANALSELAIAQWGRANRLSGCAPWASRTGGRPANPRSSACSARWTGRP